MASKILRINPVLEIYSNLVIELQSFISSTEDTTVASMSNTHLPLYYAKRLFEKLTEGISCYEVKATFLFMKISQTSEELRDQCQIQSNKISAPLVKLINTCIAQLLVHNPALSAYRIMILNLRPYEKLPDRFESGSSFWHNEPAIYGKQLLNELQLADIDEKLSKDYLWQKIVKTQKRIHGNKVCQSTVGMRGFNDLVKALSSEISSITEPIRSEICTAVSV